MLTVAYASVQPGAAFKKVGLRRIQPRMTGFREGTPNGRFLVVQAKPSLALLNACRYRLGDRPVRRLIRRRKTANLVNRQVSPPSSLGLMLEIRYIRSGRYFGCDRNCFFHSFSSSAATAGEGLPIKVDLPV